MVMFVLYVILETAKLNVQVVKGSNIAELVAMGCEHSVPGSESLLSGGSQTVLGQISQEG